jgi:integrase
MQGDGQMARTPDMRNIRERTVWRNGKLEIVYQVRVRLQDDAGILRTYTQTFDNLADAIRWRDTKRSQVQQGEIGDRLESRKLLRDTNLADLIERYKQSPRFLKKRSSANETVILDGFIKREADGLCKKSLADDLSQDFQKYVDRRPDRDGVKASTLRREINPLRHMFKVASREWGLPLDNPFDRVELPPEGGHRERILKPAERVRLYKAIDGCKGFKQKRLWVALVRTALVTGMRRGELLNLEWRDFDFENRTIYVRPEITKSKKPRLLPMTYDLFIYMGVYRDIVEETEKMATSKVFPITGSAHEQAWRRICDRAEIEDLHFHDLRHTAATSFSVKPIELSGRENAYVLGHAYSGMPRMTRLYENPEILEMVESIRKKLDAADDLFDDLRTLDDIVTWRQFSLEERQPWPELDWTQKDGRTVLDPNGPRTKEHRQREEEHNAFWRRAHEALKGIYGPDLPIMDISRMRELLSDAPNRRAVC